MYNLCKYLPKKWFTVITACEDFGICGNLGAYDKEYTFDCNIIRLPIRTYKIIDGMKFVVLTVVQGILLNKKGYLDCILAVYPNEFNLLGACLLRYLTGKPLVIYMHDLYLETRKKARLYKLYKFCEKKIFDSAALILVTNEKFQAYYSRKGIKRVAMLHSCVDLDRASIEQKKEKGDNKLKIVFTGSVYGATEDAIIAFLKAAKKINNLEIVFATPHERSYLEKISVGFLPKKKCFELQRSADVLFLPLSFNQSLLEEVQCAFPVKILEYLAARKPVLALVPKGCYVEEFIRKHNVGIVVTELSEQKIADAVNELRNEKKREFFSENASKVVCSYDAKIQADKLRSIIEWILLNKHKKAT